MCELFWNAGGDTDVKNSIWELCGVSWWWKLGRSTFFYSIFLWENCDYGGGAEHFATRIPIKEQYDTIFVNPQYDIPLFKLVCNDSVIISTHWNWSTFKIHGKTQDRMILEVLYNVSPIYHLDDEQWNEYKEDITAHNKIWLTLASSSAWNDSFFIFGGGWHCAENGVWQCAERDS